MRFILGLPIAAVITVVLFLIMRGFIMGGEYKAPDEQESVSINFTLQQQDLEVKQTSGPERPDDVEQKPPPPPVDAARTSIDTSGQIGINLEGIGIGDISGGLAQLDGDVQPLVRVPPQYPQRALSRGIEGWVLVEFDISETGAVINARVVDADPRNIFDRAAIRAVEQWKYKPRTVEGKATVRNGVRVVITFELQN